MAILCRETLTLTPWHPHDQFLPCTGINNSKEINPPIMKFLPLKLSVSPLGWDIYMIISLDCCRKCRSLGILRFTGDLRTQIYHCLESNVFIAGIAKFRRFHSRVHSLLQCRQNMCEWTNLMLLFSKLHHEILRLERIVVNLYFSVWKNANVILHCNQCLRNIT